jgi:glycopeptide antibiotics resistance protein
VGLLSNVRKLEIFVWFVFAVYLIALLKLTVFRSDFLEWPLFSHGALNADPLHAYYKLLLRHRYLDAIYQFFGNIVWFIPFGFLLPIATGRPKKLLLMLLLSLALSLIIETAQYVFGTGESELDDLLLNTLGGAVGYLFLKAYIRRLFGLHKKKIGSKQ